MADNDQERTEQPTQKRLDEAREKGQIARSPELTTAAVLLIAGAGLKYFGMQLAASLDSIMRAGLSLTHAQAFDETRMVNAFGDSLNVAILACLPVFGLTLVAALLAPMAIGGWNLALGSLAPDFNRLNPVSGFGRMFSMKGVVELVKAFAKFGIVAIIAVLVLWQKMEELIGLGDEPLHMALAHCASLCGYALLMMSGGLALIAAVDVPWQLFQHNKSLKMTREEIRQEMKESEGSPEIKGRIRQLQHEMARRRMMQDVPKADVVITNPTHFAVALRYDDQKMRAPVVVAKGADEVAARIREIAAENRVPLFEAPPLARALFRNVEIGEEIPASLYVVVAQVLTYVYQVKTAQGTGAARPTPPFIDPSIEETKH